MARARWYDRWVAVYQDELDSFGLTVADSVVVGLLQAQASHLAELMRVTEATARGYLREDDVRSAAREHAFRLAHEQPGADLFGLPRTVLLDPGGVGLAVAALSIAGRAQTSAGDSAAADQCLGLLATLGLIACDTAVTPVGVPVAWVHRAARQLTLAAGQLEAGSALPDDVDDPVGATRARMTGSLRADAAWLLELLPA